MSRNVFVIGIICILLGTTIVPVVSGINRGKRGMVNVTCRICLSKRIHEVTTQLPVEKAMEIQNEQNNEVVFALLKEYGIIPKNNSISSLRNEFQKTINENPMLIKNLKCLLLDENDDIFYNLLCFMRINWFYGTKFFVPLFMFGNSPIRGWLNFPIWMIVGWVFLQPLFEYFPKIASILFIFSLIPSTDLVDIGIGGRFYHDVYTQGLLGKRKFDDHYAPMVFSLIGFHGYHITFEWPNHGLYRVDTFIGFTLATVIIPQNN